MSYANSRFVTSTQLDPHPRLREIVHRHMHTPWLKPIPQHTQQVFADVYPLLMQAQEQTLILDSGCGTGASSFELKKHHPNALIIGIDQSEHRLAPFLKNQSIYHQPGLLLLRAELVAFWQLCVMHNIHVTKHYLLYPNPWPKATHCKRRWHAHPIWPQLLKITTNLELRTNWYVYAQEMQIALECCNISTHLQSIKPNQGGISPFEQKYHTSGHTLWQLVTTIHNM